MKRETKSLLLTARKKNVRSNYVGKIAKNITIMSENIVLFRKTKNILLYNEQMQRSHLEIIKKIMIY